MPSPDNPETVHLLQGGRALFPALIEAFDASTSWIQLETYIFDLHGSGAEVAGALVRAAQRGVVVQILVDAVGTPALPAEWLQRFTSSGVQWFAYSPVGSSLGFLVPERWRRLHRKLCVVDEKLMFCGGINILDDFYDPNHGALDAPRFDFAVVITGPLTAEATDAMALLWWRVQAGYSARQRHLSEAWENFRAAGYGGRTGTKRLSQTAILVAGRRPENTRRKAALLLRDNLRNRHNIERAYCKAIGKARRDIIIANAYFCLGENCAARSSRQPGVVCRSPCCSRENTSTLCNTMRQSRFMARYCPLAWKFTNIPPVFCMPKLRWWMVIGRLSVRPILIR